ncbi:MAG: PTS sugar transporter subunit IIA [Bacillota bacterium]
MKKATFRELIMQDVEAKTSKEVIQKVGELFLKEGFVKDTYINAVQERELVYPTGLQLEGIGIAMPHTDPEHVNKPGICIAKLKEPVQFFHMGEEDVPVEAEMIFMMAITDPNAQIETLQKVLSVFQNPEVVAQFKATTDEESLYAVAKEHIG